MLAFLRDFPSDTNKRRSNRDHVVCYSEDVSRDRNRAIHPKLTRSLQQHAEKTVAKPISSSLYVTFR